MGLCIKTGSFSKQNLGKMSNNNRSIRQKCTVLTPSQVCVPDFGNIRSNSGSEVLCTCQLRHQNDSGNTAIMFCSRETLVDERRGSTALSEVCMWTFALQSLSSSPVLRRWQL